MNCDRFDPITGSVAPCCVVCSHRVGCAKENAALDATNIRDGKSRTTTNDSTAIIADLGRKCNYE